MCRNKNTKGMRKPASSSSSSPGHAENGAIQCSDPRSNVYDLIAALPAVNPKCVSESPGYRPDDGRW